MARLSFPGVTGYNGFRFPSVAQVTVSGNPVMDSSGRTVKYVAWNLTAMWIHVSEDGPISAGAGTAVDLDIVRLRARLTSPGREIVFTAQGFGEFVVNRDRLDGESSLATGGNVLDSNYGPKPKLEIWKPSGGNRAVFIQWSCVVTIPQHCLAPAFKDKLSEFNFSVSWGIDVAGMTTRTTTGMLEIPLTWKSGTDRSVQNSADKFRKFVKKILPTLRKFQRTQNYTLSENQKFLNFTVTDTEIESDNPFQKNVIEMAAEHNIRSVHDTDGFLMWLNRIAGSVRVPSGKPKHVGWLAIQKLLFDRLGQAAKSKGIVIDSKAGTSLAESKRVKLKSALVIILDVNITEQIYGPTINFSVTYKVASRSEDIFAASGMFQKVSGDWSEWRTSIDSISGERGTAQLSHDFGQDVILDLCGGEVKTKTGESVTVLEFSVAPISKLLLGKAENIDSEHTYLQYKNFVRVAENNGFIEHKFLTATGSESLKVEKEVTAKVKTSKPKDKDAVLSPGSSAKADKTILQFRTQTSHELNIQGWAVRGIHEPAHPNLLSVAGMEITLINQWFERTQSVSLQGVILHKVEWTKSYSLIGVVPKDFSKAIKTDGFKDTFVS